MVEEHPGAGVAHDYADAFAHQRGIAMHRATTAGCFVFTKRTTGKSEMGVVEQGLTLGT